MAIAPVDAPRDLTRVQVTVLAKAPMPGLAKTRLIPALGPQGAARLRRRLTRAAVQTALDAKLSAVTLWCAPHAQHRFFRAMHQTTGVRCLVRPSGDLGQRMHTAFRLSMAQTRECASATGLRVRELEPLWDLDIPADLVRWRAWQGQHPAPMSAPAVAP